jgi:hypothetical protein
MKQLSQDEKINALIDQATESLINDSPEQAANALQELAYICSKGGKDGRQMFEQLRKLVIVGAESQTSTVFIREKLIVAERKLMESRNGRTIITH